MNEHIRAAKRQMKPAWNELRERRILEQVIEAAQEPPAEPRRRRGLWLGVGAAAAVLLLGLGLALVLVFGRGKQPLNLHRGPSDSPSSAKDPIAGMVMRAPHRVAAAPDAKEPSVVRFAEGSVALVSPGGELTVTRQEPSRIQLVQHAGSVRYRVTPGLKRSFVVSAAGVVLRVIGTEFTVTILSAGRVRVHVVRGVVETRDLKRRVRLHAGEQVLLRGRKSRPSPPPASLAPSTADGTLSKAPTQPSADEPPKAQQKRRVVPRSSAELLRQVDKARRAGRLADAARLLRTVLRRPGTDPRRRTARFILARVEASRQRHSSAAREFFRYRRSSP